MHLAHKIRLYPTKQQASYFRKACGIRRLSYNWALARWNALYEAGEKPNIYTLKKEFNGIKNEQFPFVKEVSKCACESGFFDLQSAFSNFFRKTSAYPKFKKKGKSRDSFKLNNMNFKADGFRLTVPKLGTIRMAERLRFSGKLLSATISRQADYWFVAIAVEFESEPKTIENQEVVGVDLGLKCFGQMSCSETSQLVAPKPLRKNLKKLKRLSRSLSRKTLGSNNRRKAAQKIARLHYKIGCVRSDFLHKKTTYLASNFRCVAIEDLSVKWMLANRHLSRAVADVGFFEFRRQLDYKQAIFGSDLFVADRRFPSTKACSNCGCVKEKMLLKDRTYVCEHCGFVIDRDFNAAINLENLARVNFHLPKVLREVKPVDCRENQHNEDNPCCEGYRMKQELVGSHLSTN